MCFVGSCWCIPERCPWRGARPVPEKPGVSDFSSKCLDVCTEIKGHWLFLSCPSLSSVCPKPAPCLVACSPVFPFLDTLSNTDAVSFYMTVLFIYFYISALLLGFCSFFFCLHKRKVSVLEKPNTSVFLVQLSCVCISVSSSCFPSTDMKAPGECFFFLSCQGLYVC